MNEQRQIRVLVATSDGPDLRYLPARLDALMRAGRVAGPVELVVPPGCHRIGPRAGVGVGSIGRARRRHDRQCRGDYQSSLHRSSFTQSGGLRRPSSAAAIVVLPKRRATISRRPEVSSAQRNAPACGGAGRAVRPAGDAGRTPSRFGPDALEIRAASPVSTRSSPPRGPSGSEAGRAHCL